MTKTSGPSTPPSPVRVLLVQDQRAPGEARRATREVLLGWRLPWLVDAVVLAVSELVTNAVRHGAPPVALELSRQRASVPIGVHDGDPAEPRTERATAGEQAESGRGLNIVQALAVEVSCEQVPNDGKVIYASFGVARDGDAPTAP